MTSSVEDLKQDIRSLKSEMELLSVKSANLKERINKLKQPHLKKKKKHQKRKIFPDDEPPQMETEALPPQNKRFSGVMNEFGPIFEKFPQLHDILYKEYHFQDDKENEEEESDYESDYSSFSSSSSSSSTGNRAITPQKRRKTDSTTGNRETNNTNDDDLPEYEWVLKNQQTIEHKMFDTSVGDMLDTTILSSPSKRKQRPMGGRRELNDPKLTKLKNDIILENMFRLFGVTFFPVIDPTDLQLNVDTQELDVTREMLGIRFDLFNQVLRRFETPFYILLKRKLKSKSWAIFKHTIPSYIDIEILFVDITLNGTSSNGFEDIYLFAKEIYLQLWQNSIRNQLFDGLVQDEIISIIYNDMRSTRVQFEVADTPIKLELQLNKDQIKSVRIMEGIPNADVQSNVSMVLLGSIYELKYKLNMIKLSIYSSD
ncbi:inner kinetochore subunit Mcm21p [Monosporozyma unispora]|nr:minichromosome maintenance protein [Kazachstania unispora]